jgi:DNA-binding transcriptional ArsR family regulator
LTIRAASNTFNLMVELHAAPDPARLDAVFHALGDATRRNMLRDLASGQRTVGELAAPFDMSLAAASKHIRSLEKAGLVRRTIRGRTHVCRLEPRALADAHEWISFYERFWNSRFDVLEDLLRRADTPDPQGDEQ